jgi:ribosomal-protein-alanine N-acetyltransferase
MTSICKTERLVIRKFALEDAPFILELLNTKGWLEFIGDRNIKTLEDARNYIVNIPFYMYEKLGFGPYLVKLKDADLPIGMCSLIKRDILEDVDIGFAFLPEYAGKGYAFEATLATLHYSKKILGIHRVIAITNSNNNNSIHLLKKLGLDFEKTIKLPGEAEELLLFGN